MKGERLNSEKKINCNNFKLKIGTINKKNPIVIYIDGNTFITPTLDKENYNDDILNIKKKFLYAIRNNLNKSSLFDNNFILDFDVKNSGLKIGKKSFLSFQCHLRQKNNVFLLNDIKNMAKNLINSFVNSLETELKNNNFLINKYKS